MAKAFIKLSSCKIWEMARPIGTLISACQGVKYDLSHTKELERSKYLALSKTKNNFEKKMDITRKMQNDLIWWSKNVMTTKNPIRSGLYKLEIFTGASRSGWGAICKCEKANGWWSIDDSKDHIKILELKAAFYGLKCFAEKQRSCELLLRIDNTTAIAYLNKMGGIQKEKLSSLSREIWEWCEKRDLWLFASYINTKSNVDADKESRVIFRETEWELSPKAYDKIVDKFGNFDIDLFASKANAKCDIYVSWKTDPDSLTVDAFTISWEKFFFYAFPPFSIILRVLQKIQNDKSEGVLVVPWWPTQSWFPLFTELCISTPVKFKPAPDSLISSSREIHPFSATLSLAAAKLSGKLS